MSGRVTGRAGDGWPFDRLTPTQAYVVIVQAVAVLNGLLMPLLIRPSLPDLIFGSLSYPLEMVFYFIFSDLFFLALLAGALLVSGGDVETHQV